ncbi:MAG: hypothetical protein A2Y57_02925 [Candidatus Woykebacteria bacterium RBG_13_40_7b]|uniref:Nudix hydrolase domain-containing protein n=1 Tax=Candidatus Woykebacteria bacterium RBG_13_40_7b TaxID=1802594 RepID=A0A1G1W592_9BACT|nr:MAG: hypothetical protein A2Y57_02925 [Candidatus Woykebacteria bacterium RBG_13_40_7b]
MNEIKELELQFGEPRVYDFKLEVSASFSPPFDSRHSGKEIVLVLRSSGGKIWLHRKTYYPKDGFRLQTGGIKSGEKVYDALRRELKEETGIEKDPDKFLAIINYQLTAPQIKTDFVDYLFLFDGIDVEPKPEDLTENIAELKPVDIGDFPSVINVLSNQPDNSPNTDKQIGLWSDWGKFRALSHEVVYDLLKD